MSKMTCRPLCLETLENRLVPAMMPLRNFAYSNTMGVVSHNTTGSIDRSITAHAGYEYGFHSPTLEQGNTFDATAAVHLTAKGQGLLTTVEMLASGQVAHQTTSTTLFKTPAKETGEMEQAMATLHIRGSGHFTFDVDMHATTWYAQRYYLPGFSPDNRLQYLENASAQFHLVIDGTFDITVVNTAGDRRNNFIYQMKEQQTATVLEGTTSAAMVILGAAFTVTKAQVLTSTGRISSYDGAQHWDENSTNAFFVGSAANRGSGALYLQSSDLDLNGCRGLETAHDRVFASSAAMTGGGKNTTTNGLGVAMNDGSGSQMFFDPASIALYHAASSGKQATINTLLFSNDQLWNFLHI